MLLSQTRLIVMPCLRTSISLKTFVQTLWMVVPCLRTSISLKPLFKHVWVVVPCGVQASASSPVFQTCLDCGFLFVYKHQSPALFQTRLDVVHCLCTRINLQPCVSNTFDYGCLFVYPPAHTNMKVTSELEKILHEPELRMHCGSSWRKSNYLGIGSTLRTVNSLRTKFSNGSNFATVERGLRSNFTLRPSTVYVPQTMISRSTCPLPKHTSADSSESQTTPCSCGYRVCS